MRNELMAVLGGGFYVESLVIVEIRGEPIIWFERDEDSLLMLNVRMLTTSSETRMQIENNFWVARGEPDDFECPPSGRLIHAKYSNGDTLRVEFFEAVSGDELIRRFPTFDRNNVQYLSFPITCVEVQHEVADSPWNFGPTSMTDHQQNVFTGSFFQGGMAAYSFDNRSTMSPPRPQPGIAAIRYMQWLERQAAQRKRADDKRE